MTGVRAHLRAVLRATRIVSPTGFSWFGRESRQLPPSLERASDPTHARAILVAALEARLYADLYCAGRAVPSRRTGWRNERVRRTGFVEALAAANAGRGGWQLDCAVTSRRDGEVTMLLYGVEATAPLSAVRPAGEGLDRVDVRLPRESLRASPGYYFAFGDAGLAPRRQRRVVRWYWHLRPGGAAPLVATLTGTLNGAGIPFSLKVLADPAAYDRCDAGVLYTDSQHVEAIRRLLRPVHLAVGDHLRPMVPVFTRAVGPGLGIAEDPGGGQSFGASRCRLLAEGIVGAAELGARSIEARLDTIAVRFAAAGLDLRRPWLSPGSEARYGLVAGRPRRTVSPGPVRAMVTRRPTGDDAAAGAQALIRRLVRTAVWHEDRCTWMGGVVARPGVVEALGASVYNGTAGVALALAEAGAAFDDAKGRRTAVAAARHALSRLQRREIAGIGLHSGGPGIALAAARVGVVTGDDGLVERALTVARGLQPQAEPAAAPDLLAGRAGAVLALLCLASLADDQCLLPTAVELGEQLLATADRSETGWSWRSPRIPTTHNLCGLSHGASGIACALLELARQSGDDRFATAAREAFTYERHQFDAGHGNWPDHRRLTDGRARPRGRAMVAWCHGAGGIALARLRAGELLGDRSLMDEARIGVRAVVGTVGELSGRGEPGDLGLCHGLAGHAQILLDAARQLGADDDVGRLAAEQADGLVRVLNRYGVAGDIWPCGAVGDETPALMTGAAGGLHVLTNAAGARPPSVVLPIPGPAWSSPPQAL